MPRKNADNQKQVQLNAFREVPDGAVLTGNQGVPITHTDDSIKAGERGASLLQDFHLREKITQFDHERIPERVVHARGAGAHGFFELTESLAEYTTAKLFTEVGMQTPTFVRFSTVAGSRGSADTARDVRGFATKFYTSEGNYDLVGNNMPVFFIQDGIKFPDLVHAVKPEPDREIPQAASAHDSFWDFVSLQPETAHMVMWAMSDRAIPRSYAMMEGFGVHTFRLINAAGKSTLVKFHWKPVLGSHSLAWDEAQLLAGTDPDFHRRDLWDSIEAGNFPEYEFGVQLMEEEDALKYGFDLLDATKLVPEELVPVRKVGRMVLNRNPDNFFAETEQVAFHVGHLLPGIDVTPDPLMQARLFSYLDTQLTRLAGPNFHEIPINKAVAPVHNHQQDGFHRQTINTGKANYHPNSIGGGQPALAPMDRGYVPYAAPVSGFFNRERSPSFKDYFSQAKMFVASQSPAERRHMVKALQFELGKVLRPAIRERMIGEVLARIDLALAQEVAAAVGVEAPAAVPAPLEDTHSVEMEPSPALSLENQRRDSLKGRKVAVIVGPGFSGRTTQQLERRLKAEGVAVEYIADALGAVAGAGNVTVQAMHTLRTARSVMFDAVYVPGGESAATLGTQYEVMRFLVEASRHGKTIGATDEAVAMLPTAGIAVPDSGDDPEGIVVNTGGSPNATFADRFIEAMKQHRHWMRAGVE